MMEELFEAQSMGEGTHEVKSTKKKRKKKKRKRERMRDLIEVLRPRLAKNFGSGSR